MASSQDFLQPEKSCPLQPAHTRLRQAHDLWHEAARNYPFPEDFVRNLSQLIVTLRQVTFMLQTQKEKIEDFDTWYEEGWRERLKADPIMAWLHDARTKIEHVGDLDLESTAKVTVIASWLDGPYAELEVPPHLGPEEIAAQFDSSDMPDRIRAEGLLKVERRWISSDLPDQELTEVCAYGYGVLATILAEAHGRLGVQMQTFGMESHKRRHERNVHLGGRLPCMLMTEESRTAHLHLASGNLVELERAEREISFSQAEAERFEQQSQAMLVDPAKALSFAPDQDPIDVARQVSAYACRVLAHDGYHRPIAFLLDENNDVLSITEMNFRDQAEKYLLFRSLATNAERLGAVTAIQVGETWGARVPTSEVSPKMKRPTERADRIESLSVMAATADGREASFHTDFTRDSKDKPILGKTRAGRGRQLNASFLPLTQMWGKRRASA